MAKKKSDYKSFFYMLDIKKLHIEDPRTQCLPVEALAYLRLTHDRLWMIANKRIPKMNIPYIWDMPRDRSDPLLKMLLESGLLIEHDGLVGSEEIDECHMAYETYMQTCTENGKKGGRKPKTSLSKTEKPGG